mgnify:CR=1 FL=1
MFGYIVPRLNSLSEDTQKRYQAFYCGMCKSIGQLSGRSGRMLLSHDMTFLAILLNSLMEPEEVPQKIRCAVHPVHSREIIQGKAVEFAAGMNLLLMDLKCEDQIRDDESRLGAAERKILRKPVELLQLKYPRQNAGITSALDALWEEAKVKELKS